MEDLSRNARTLLARLRNEELADPAARARVRRALHISVGKIAGLTLLSATGAANAGAALAPAAATLSAAGTGTATVGATTLAQVAASMLIGALAGVGVIVPASYLSQPSPSVAVHVQPAPTHSATARAARAARPLVVNPTTPRSADEAAVKAQSPLPLAAPRGDTRAPTDDTLASETRWLEVARSRLKAGQAEESLKLLEQYEQAFPKRILGEEAAASKVVALCASGRTSEAERESLRFQAAYPGSPLRSRVAAVCGGEPP